MIVINIICLCEVFLKKNKTPFLTGRQGSLPVFCLCQYYVIMYYYGCVKTLHMQ